MVKIRLSKMGKRNNPIYRIVVADSRRARDSECLEVIGHYNPKKEGEIVIKEDRFKYWIEKGAQPTDRVKALLKAINKNLKPKGGEDEGTA